MNVVDRLVAFFAPTTGMRRAIARQALASVSTRRYDAAGHGRRMDGWQARGTSANAEVALGQRNLRDRHRDLVRNNPWAQRAVEAIVNNTVGYGITAKVAGKGTSKTAAKLWKEWAETTACDADGKLNIYGLQALWLHIIVESGSVLIRRRQRRESDGLPVPMQLQTLEPDYLDEGKTERLTNGGWIQNGVQFSPFGKREGYWLFAEHPGDQLAGSATSTLVPAREVAHIFKKTRAPQATGVPWGHAVMLTLRDLDDYEDAYLLRQKLANCQVGAIYDARDSGYGGVEAPAATPEMSESMEPGRYDFLPAGKDIKFNTPPSAGDFGPYTKSVLYRVAAGYGITFQALTGDLTSVNFSSGRMGWLEMQRNVDAWRWNMLIPQGCDVVAGWFVEDAVAAGIKSVRGTTFAWTPPRREMIDPVKEIGAYGDAMRLGIMPLSTVHRELGEDSDAVLEEFAAVNKKVDQLQLVFDSDPRKTTGKQTTATPAPAAPATEDEEA